MNIFYTWFLVLQLLTSSARELQVHVHRITVNHDGRIAYGSTLPTCGSSKIRLLSYKYFNCDTSCDFSSGRSLSAASELIIHEMCSMKQTCAQSTFPMSDTYNERIIQLEYHCLDLFDTFLDICDNTSKSIKGTIHLMNRGNVSSSQICQCTVKGTFSLELTDVRLKATYGNQCSEAKLQILNQTYICDGTEDGYGSVYRNNVGETLSEVVVMLTTDSKAYAGPEMIYLTIVSTVPVEIWCQSMLRYNMSAPWRTKGSSITVPATASMEITTRTSIGREIAVPVWAMAVISGLGGLLIISSGVAFYYRRKLAQSSRFDGTHADYLTCTETAARPETLEIETRTFEMTAPAPSMDTGTSSEMPIANADYAPMARAALDQHSSQLLKESEQYEIPDVDPTAATETTASYELLSPKSRSNGNDYAIPADLSNKRQEH